MTASEEIFDQAGVDIFKTLGQDATYTPVVGEAVSCKVILEQNVDLQPEGLAAAVFAQGVTIECLIADVLTEPDRGATFVIGAVTWTVQFTLENDGRFVKLMVK